MTNETLIHPVEKYKEYITQAYGVPNKIWYPLSGFHIGTDYACPDNTLVKAPIGGEVITAGKSRSLGNYCHYQYAYKGQVYVERWLHLSIIPKIGEYKQNETVAITGGTGRVTGDHLHQDIWLDEVRLDLINSKNWRELTINPQTHYK